MPIDQYSPCPCGSGKKMKFCKCVEQPQEYEKINRLIEGGQELAAMDRINQMLKKTPNVAWLLAVKAQLALEIQELDTFRETANRFLKLKPDNPLALIMKSLVCTLDAEPVENTANYLLQGLSEARETLPSSTLVSITLLIRALVSSNHSSLVGFWAEVLDSFTANIEDYQAEELPLRDARLNVLCKSTPQLIDSPPGAAWKERLNEVLSLVRTFRFAQAESKLRAILRDFPDQPGPLSHLLRGQCAQLNQSGAHATAVKLSEHPDVPSHLQAYYGALALELEPDQPSISPEMLVRYCEVESSEQVLETLGQLDYVSGMSGPPEELEQIMQYYAMLVGDEVPAKAVYSIFSDSIKQSDEPAERKIGSPIATVAVYGKQTDRPARVLVMGVRYPAFAARLDELVNTVRLGNDIPDFSPPLHRFYSEFLSRPRFVVGNSQAPLTLEERGAQISEEFLNLPLPLFGGLSPLEAADDSQQKLKLMSLLSHFEGEQSLVCEDAVIDGIYQRLNVQRPASQLEINQGRLRFNNGLDLVRVDPHTLDDRALAELMMRCLALSLHRTIYRVSRIVRDRPSLANDNDAQLLALAGLKQLSPDPEQRIDYSRQLLEKLATAGMPLGREVVELFGMLQASGRTAEAQQVLLDAAQKYPEDPYLLSFFQYMMQAQGQGGPAAAPGRGDDLAMRMMQHSSNRAVEPTEDSGLVLPGQQSPAAGGGSKLWLPGS